MPNIRTRNEWKVYLKGHKISGENTPRIYIPVEHEKILKWGHQKKDSAFQSAIIAKDTLLIWKKSGEPEVSVIARRGISDLHNEIEFDCNMQNEYLEGGEIKNYLFRFILTSFMLGFDHIEIIAPNINNKFRSELDKKLAIEFNLASLGTHREYLGNKQYISRLRYEASDRTKAEDNLSSLYDETLTAINSLIEFILSEEKDKSIFEDCAAAIRTNENTCDLQKRYLLRNLEKNKIDELANLPYLALIIKHLEPISDDCLDIINHIGRLNFKIPELFINFVKDFKNKIIDENFFIDPTQKNYSVDYLNKVIDACYKFELEDSFNVMEELENCQLGSRELVNTCFLVSKFARICRNLHNIAEIKYNWIKALKINKTLLENHLNAENNSNMVIN